MNKAAIILLAVLGTCSSGTERVVVMGEQGYTPMRLRDLPPGSSVDLSQAEFTVANSRNGDPDDDAGCRTGKGYVNRYPLAVIDSPSVNISGGRFVGTVPQESDWVYTYCNSAALRVETSVSSRMENQRIDAAWDAIRVDDDSENFVIDGVWISNNRDDCIENDDVSSGEIRDSLFDRCFAGISVAPRFETAKRAALEVDALLMRMESYVYKEEVRHALPFKVEGEHLRLNIRDSIIAVETRDLIGGGNVETMWRSIEKCSNNLLLWLGEGRAPKEIRARPRCFELVSGDEAFEIWEKARRNWIHCHPDVPRIKGDPDSRIERCERTEYGGLGLEPAES